MKLNLYTIYDTAAVFYKNPFAMQTDAQAMREFTDIFDGDNPIAKHPEHYSLAKMGTFDNSTAIIEQKGYIRKTLLTGLEALALRNKTDQQNNPPWMTDEQHQNNLNEES